jgi:hypothetical protein
MPNERLLDLTPAERLEIANDDPRARLMELVWSDPQSRALLQRETKRLRPAASILEVDLPAQFQAELAKRDTEIAALKTELGGDKTARARTQFRADLVAYAEEFDFRPDDKELDDIETFMVENQYGVKAARDAVRSWIDTKHPAEPSFESEHTFTFEDEDDDYIKKLRAAPIGADTSALTLAHAERLSRQMGVFGKDGKLRRSPAFAGR